VDGDIWLRPTAEGGHSLYVYCDNRWVLATSSGSSSDTHIVSPTAPPPPDQVGDLWIQPESVRAYSHSKPPVYGSAIVEKQANGRSIGWNADGSAYHEPVFVGAVPIVAGGKKYLIPLIEPSRSEMALPQPSLFTYGDKPVTQRSDGKRIGRSADGSVYSHPQFVGGIYVIVAGKRFLVPLIEG
jgi:hypothetical protein